MTLKKMRNQKARDLRKNVKGLTLPMSKKIVAIYDDTIQTLNYLRNNGFNVFVVTNSHCSLDGSPLGKYNIYKNNQYCGYLNFDCCGISLNW